MSTFQTYQSLLDSSLTETTHLAEAKVDYRYIKERHLQAMWLEQRYFKDLLTVDGQLIKVISPGIWNSAAGPDFLKAHLKIGDFEWRGDVELHLAEEGWYQHHHHLDKNYDDVILHISYWPPTKRESIRTSKGRSILRTSLQNHLIISESKLTKLIDLDLYPYKNFVGSGTCARTLFCHLPEEKIASFFRLAANWRLKQKYQFLNSKAENNYETILVGMALALGYKANAYRFLEIYSLLKTERNLEETELFIVAIGLCGFFNSYYRKKWSKSPYYQFLLLKLETLPATLLAMIEKSEMRLKLDKIRPINHPIRRLAILVKIINDKYLLKLLDHLNDEWEKNWLIEDKKKWQRLKNAFLQLIPEYEDSYWNQHYIFEVNVQVKKMSLIGDDLRKEMLFNIFLPLLSQSIEKRNNRNELKAFEQFYASLSNPQSQKIKYLTQRFFGDTNKMSLLSKADIQQGAYQIHRDFCIHFEASCVNCPFVERFNASFNNQ